MPWLTLSAVASFVISAALFAWAFLDSSFDTTFELTLWWFGFSRTPCITPTPRLIKRHFARSVAILGISAISVASVVSGGISIAFANRGGVSSSTIWFTATQLMLLTSVALLPQVHALGHSWRLRQKVFRLIPIVDRIISEWPGDNVVINAPRDGAVRILPVQGYRESILTILADNKLEDPDDFLSGTIVVRDRLEEKCALAFHVETDWWIVYSADGYIPDRLTCMQSLFVLANSKQMTPNWYQAKYCCNNLE
ncbi:MAG: hypothetical protein ACO1RA_05710 [Planctomycetaceae bacterium]